MNLVSDCENASKSRETMAGEDPGFSPGPSLRLRRAPATDAAVALLHADAPLRLSRLIPEGAITCWRNDWPSVTL